MNGKNILVYGGTSHHSFDSRVLATVNQLTNLDLKFSHLWYHTWPDGEPGFRPEDHRQVAGKDIIVFACPINAKLKNELSDLITALKHQYEARSVIAVFSFMMYRRQDHEDIEHEITRLRWFIRDLRHWGTDRLVVCDPHSLQHTKKYCEEFGLSLHVSDPTKLFAIVVKDVVTALGGADSFKIYSPDFGSVRRAVSLARELGMDVVATPKRRINGRVLSVDNWDFLATLREVYGSDIDSVPFSCDLSDLKGKHVLMREDEIDTGSTAILTAWRLREIGATSIRLIATHPVCSPGWKIKFFPHAEAEPFDTIWLGNTRPRGREETEYEGSTGGRIEEVDIAPVIAGTLRQVITESQS